MNCSETIYFKYNGPSGDVRIFQVKYENNLPPLFVTQLIVQIGKKQGVHYCIGIYKLSFSSFASKYGEINPIRKGSLHNTSEDEFKNYFLELINLLN